MVCTCDTEPLRACLRRIGQRPTEWPSVLRLDRVEQPFTAGSPSSPPTSSQTRGGANSGTLARQPDCALLGRAPSCRTTEGCWERSVYITGRFELLDRTKFS